MKIVGLLSVTDTVLIPTVKHILIVVCIAGLAAPDVARGDNTIDILIKNARILDGTGSPWTRGDIAIADGRIRTIGPSLDVAAHRTIDAEDRFVAPGFIDVHVHVESVDGPWSDIYGLRSQPMAENFLRDGVTTIVTGNCGNSEVDIAEFRYGLKDIGINVATLIGHNSVRRHVMGLDNRQPTNEEMLAMEALVERAMADGAMGLSTGLLYTPGRFADTEEVDRLAKVTARYGGIYVSHIRNQGARLAESIDEVARIAESARIPAHVSHLKIKGRSRWGRIGETIEQIQRYRRNGLDITLDTYPYDRSSTGLNVLLPPWVLTGDRDAVTDRLRDADSRAQIATEMRRTLTGQGFSDYSFATVAGFVENSRWVGKNIHNINSLLGNADTLDNEIGVILDLMAAAVAAGNHWGPPMIYHYMSMADVETILRYEHTIVASDGEVFAFGKGLPHPRSYGTHARTIARFVNDSPVLSIEEAIRRMTAAPARRFGFYNRGILNPGFVADIIIFDVGNISDTATFDNPHSYSTGFDFVIVNGVVVIDDGETKPQRPGQFIPNATIGGPTLPNSLH